MYCSRSSEDWLADQTFADNVYDLSGLDSEAASTLAERILERHKATRYHEDPDLLHLLKLLDGFPLALEVVLANLARQDPKHILEALQAGNVELDKGDTQKKTESIIQCINYSHSNLSPEAQQLLLCLAPFTSVVNQNGLELYTQQLKQQSMLADLPFERWSDVIQQALSGLLSPDPDMPGYLHLQPVLPYFLHNRLNTPEQAEIKAAIEIAFRQYYDEVGGALYALLQSKEPEERRLGQTLTKLEYENLMVALKFALDAQVSMLNLYRALSSHLDTTQEQQRGLELGEAVLKRLEIYPDEKLTSELRGELASVIYDIAGRQLLLKQYVEAEASYKKALANWLDNKMYDEKTIKHRSASIYHDLGIVAQQQRQWQQAEAYYQQALQIGIEFQDRYSQASAYHNLGTIAEEQRQWQQARDYFLRALETFVHYEDGHSYIVVLRGLARLWQATGDATLLPAVASILGGTSEEVEKLFSVVFGVGGGK